MIATPAPAWSGAGAQLFTGDARAVLATLPDRCVHACVTSPPYWGLRSYGTEPAVWGGDPACAHDWRGARYYRSPGAGLAAGDAWTAPGPANAARIKAARWREDATCARCDAWRGELGQEPTPGRYVANIAEVLAAVARVLRPDGTCWLVLGDSYAGSWGNYAPGGIVGAQRPRHDGGERWRRRAYADSATRPVTSSGAIGIPSKSLCLMPARVALAAQSAGWLVRSVVVWEKPNAMPASVRDRPTTSHEYVLMLARGPRYYYDPDAIRPPWADARAGRSGARTPRRRDVGGRSDGYARPGDWQPGADQTGPNARTVWRIPTVPYRGAHFATYPPALAARCIAAATSARGVCSACGTPWRGVVERVAVADTPGGHGSKFDAGKTAGHGLARVGHGTRYARRHTGEWRAGCTCGADPYPATVLDPFSGTATTGAAALDLGRRYVGIDLAPASTELGAARLAAHLKGT